MAPRRPSPTPSDHELDILGSLLTEDGKAGQDGNEYDFAKSYSLPSWPAFPSSVNREPRMSNSWSDGVGDGRRGAMVDNDHAHFLLEICNKSHRFISGFSICSD